MSPARKPIPPSKRLVQAVRRFVRSALADLRRAVDHKPSRDPKHRADDR